MGESIKVKKLGKYILKEKLGEGSMGSVWLSYHTGLSIPVAIKLLNMDLAAEDPDFLNRFMQEGRLAGQLNHKNIVRIYDAGIEGKNAYIVMEFIEGCDTLELLESRGALPPDEVLALAISVTEALAEAHSLGIIHRDIKPDNILATNEGRIKLADLGLAKHVDDNFGSTIAGTALGTPYYIAPEQALDALKADQRSDIYSLGATLYHLLTGFLPFEGDNIMGVMLRHTNEPLVPPQEKKPGLPENFCSVICKMMEKKPNKRYQSCAELLDDLNKLKYGQEDLSTSEAELKRNLASGKSVKIRMKQPISGKYKKNKSKKARSAKHKANSTVPNRGLPVILAVIAVALIVFGAVKMINSSEDKPDDISMDAASQTNQNSKEIQPDIQKEPTEIVDGIDLIKNIDDFFQKDPNGNFKVVNGILHVDDLNMRKPHELISRENHKQYNLEVEYRWLDNYSDSGIHFHKDGQQFYEVNMVSADNDRTGTVYGRHCSYFYDGRTRFIHKLTETNEKPVKEWNNIKFIVKDESITTILNGRLLHTITGKNINDGKLALTIWNRCKMEIRKFHFTEID